MHEAPVAHNDGPQSNDAIVTALVSANGTTDYFEIFANDGGGSTDVDGTVTETYFQGHFIRS